MDSIIWKESRTRLGVTADLAVLHRGGRIFLVGRGSGYGCSVGPREVELFGDGDLEFHMGDCGNAAINAFLRIRNWRRTSVALSCDLGVWGSVGSGPWVPPGGEWFRVFGRLDAFASASELGQYLQGGYADELREHGVEVGEDAPAGVGSA
jgi:hypothetical protein